MTKLSAIVAVLGFALGLDASVQVPQDIRNPFEVPDPTIGFKTASSAAKPVDTAAQERAAAFAKVQEKLYSLPVRGIITRMKNASSGGVTVLLGNYTIFEGMPDIPSAEFDIPKGIIRVVQVTPERIVFKVSIGLESKDISLPIAR